MQFHRNRVRDCHRRQIDTRYRSRGGYAAGIHGNAIRIGGESGRSGQIAGLGDPASPVAHIGDGAVPAQRDAERSDAASRNRAEQFPSGEIYHGQLVLRDQRHGRDALSLGVGLLRNGESSCYGVAKAARDGLRAAVTDRAQLDLSRLVGQSEERRPSPRIEANALQSRRSGQRDVVEHAVLIPVEPVYPRRVQDPQLGCIRPEGHTVDSALEDGWHAGRRDRLACGHHAGIGYRPHGFIRRLGVRNSQE